MLLQLSADKTRGRHCTPQCGAQGVDGQKFEDIEVYARRTAEKALAAVIQEAYVHGVSTHSVPA